MTQAQRPPRPHWSSSPLLWILASIAGVGMLLAVLYALGIHQQVVTMLQWIDRQGAWAAILFIVVMALAVLLLLPGVLFTTGAGFVFGIVEGTLYVVTGTVLGAAAAFLIARYLMGQRARKYVINHARLAVMNDELTPHGWKIVLLSRLIPFFPAKVSNFVFGLTNFSFRGFVGGSILGFIPFSLHNVYLGSLAAEITTMAVRESSRSPLEWSIYGIGFVSTVIAVLYLNRLARRALGRYTDNEIPEEVP